MNTNERSPGSAEAATTQNRAASHRLFGLLAALPAVIAAAILLYFLPAIAGGEAVRVAYAWVPSLGISLSFYLDGLSLVFGVLITGIGAIVLVYCSSYLAGHPHFGRFLLYLLLFMFSMLGLVLADNLITLFVFWEMTTMPRIS